MNQSSLWVTEILCSFRLVLQGKTGKVIFKSSRFEFKEKNFANSFTLTDAEDNTSGPLNTWGVADLPLLRTLLAIRQKSQEPGFWEVMDSFDLVAHGSLAASRTFTSLFELYFRFRSDFYEIWQQHKQLKTMEMSEAWSDTYDEEYTHQFQPEPTHKIH